MSICLRRSALMGTNPPLNHIFVSVFLSEFPPIPSPPHVNHTLSVLADSGVSSYSGINAEFSESLDGRKKFGKISFPPKNSSEFCTHRLTRARLPTFVVASLTALGFFTRKLRTPKLGRVGRAQAMPTPSLEPSGSLRSQECLVPLLLHRASTPLYPK